jgi:hypothetical protein
MGAYIQALSELYPPSLAEGVYAYLALAVQRDTVELDGEDFGIDAERAHAGIDQWLEVLRPSPRAVERVMLTTQIRTRNATAYHRLLDHHVQNFDIQVWPAYEWNTDEAFRAARDRVYRSRK